jgi:methanogenic corrinoid protein MtbC1
VGQLWETNQITVATEHIATAISEGIMNELYDRITTGKKYTKKVVVACVDNEHHQVGIKMVADVFEMNGWDSFFPGSGIPTSELVKFIHEIKPDILAISLSVYFNFANLLRMLESLRKEFPELPIILGGMAFTHISGEALNRLENIVIMKDLYELSNYIDSLNANFK